jgi:hypothetical protein
MPIMMLPACPVRLAILGRERHKRPNMPFLVCAWNTITEPISPSLSCSVSR